MRQLVLQMQITLDGFLAGPNGELDWVFKSLDDIATAWIVDRLWQAGVHVMGSKTFADMAAYWPSSSEPYAAPMNAIPKVVFSRNGVLAETTRALEDASRHRAKQGAAARPVPASTAASWARPQVAGGELRKEIARLKRQQGKEILAHGGAGFARSLAQARLVDEYRLLVHPVAIGRGMPLFSDLDEPLDLTLVSSTPFAGGTVAQVYRPTRQRRTPNPLTRDRALRSAQSR